MSSLPELSKLMGYGLLEDDVLQFFAKICKKQLELRQSPNAVKRGDFLDVMIAGLHAPLWSGKSSLHQIKICQDFKNTLQKSHYFKVLCDHKQKLNKAFDTIF